MDGEDKDRRIKEKGLRDGTKAGRPEKVGN